MNQEIFFPVGETEIKLDVEFSLQNDGIGSYECHGFKGFDAGSDYLEIEDIVPVWDNEPALLRSAFMKRIDNDFEKLSEEVEPYLKKENA